jgi:hypothetical protein
MTHDECVAELDRQAEIGRQQLAELKAAEERAEHHARLASIQRLRLVPIFDPNQTRAQS